jgi:hypothetical protein
VAVSTVGAPAAAMYLSIPSSSLFLQQQIQFGVLLSTFQVPMGVGCKARREGRVMVETAAQSKIYLAIYCIMGIIGI